MNVGEKNISIWIKAIFFMNFFFKFVNGILRNWESLCDIRPDCHHHFDASGTSNAMFDELAERSLMSPLAGTKHTYARLAIIIYCQILALFFKFFKHLKILFSWGRRINSEV